VKDVLFGIENIVTGAANDTIIASTAHNVMDGGAGNDTFVFKSAAHVDGDTILNFQPGDKIDLSDIMGDTVTLVNGVASPGQIGISHEQINGEDFTVLRANLDADTDSEFTLNIKGHHTLTGANFA
jgi:Ca2+-binding RTX toxin-like protein